MTNKPLGERVGCCPTCGPERHAVVLSQAENRGEDGDVSWCTTFRTLQCGGCKNLYVEKNFWFSEDVVYDEEERAPEYWPVYLKYQPPEWFEKVWRIDKTLLELLSEMYKAAANDMPVCAAIAVRTAFDRASDLLKVAKSLPFSKKLERLKERGILSPLDKKVLETVVDAGNAAAHRGWKPNHDELRILITALESFLYRAFFLQAATKGLKKNVPKKPRRVKQKKKKPTSKQVGKTTP